MPPPLKTSFDTKLLKDGWKSFSEVNIGYAIPFDGSINLWEYVACSTNGVYLQVYRIVSGTTYRLMGQNFVKKSINKKINKVSVNAKNRINVRKGDFIGWTFVGKVTFGFSISQGKTLWSKGNGVSFKKVGGTFDFPGSGKRLYQCRATVSPGKSPNPAPTSVIVPPPLKTSFDTKLLLDGWKSFSEVNTGFSIPSDGTIGQWEYFGGSTSGVYLQVYRLVSGSNYKLIGQNFVKKSVNKKINKVIVKANDRINVKKGDFIGWTFVGKAAFGFSFGSDKAETRWSSDSGVTSKTIGATSNFAGSGHRRYQCRATIFF